VKNTKRILSIILCLAMVIGYFTMGVAAAEETTKTYTFSNYSAGTQYAKGEVHKLDDVVTVTTTDSHFTTQLRLYSSTTNNGYAVIEVPSTHVISGLKLNAGYKQDTLNVFGSDDGATWTEIGGVAISSSYKDYTVDFGGKTYRYLKLDVKGTQQIRIQSITLTYINVGGGTTEPSEPVVTEPVVTEPVVTEPVVTEPVVTEPVETEPAVEQTVTMNIFANTGALSNDVISWVSGDVTFSNAKDGSSTNIRTSDADHFRIYANRCRN
jgi:hypothetical protein